MAGHLNGKTRRRATVLHKRGTVQGPMPSMFFTMNINLFTTKKGKYKQKKKSVEDRVARAARPARRENLLKGEWMDGWMDARATRPARKEK